MAEPESDCASVLPIRRRWQKLANMFADSAKKHCSTGRSNALTKNVLVRNTRRDSLFYGSALLNGLFIKFDKRGRRLAPPMDLSILVSHSLGMNEVTFVTHSGGTNLQFLWTDTGKQIRLKRMHKTTMIVKKTKQRIDTIYNETLHTRKTRKSKNFYDLKREMKKCKHIPEMEGADTGIDMEYKEDSENEDGNDKKVYHKPFARLNKSLRHIFTDKETHLKRSKVRSLHFELLTSENYCVQCWPVPKCWTQKDVFASETFHQELVDEDWNEEVNMKNHYAHNFTLGDFCSVSVKMILGLPIENSDDTLSADSLNLDWPSNHNMASIGNSTNVHVSQEQTLSPCDKVNYKAVEGNVEPVNSTERRTSSWTKQNINLENISKGVCNVDDSFIATSPKSNTTVSDSAEHREEIYVTVQILRAIVRPDMLNKEFKLDYREAACKPRRFVINISRLMYHHFAFVHKPDFKVIPKTDLSTYLIFVFCHELTQEVDEYRVWISSDWIKPSHALDLFKNVDGAYVSIHDLIQITANALDVNIFSNLNRQEITCREDLGNQPVCLFTLLNALTKWKIHNKDLPISSEWGDDYNITNGFYDHQSSEDNGYTCTKAMKKPNISCEIVNRGPVQPSICGLCFSDLKFAMTRQTTTPLALTACSHWFCEQCWKYRLNLKPRMKELMSDVICLEDKCKTKIDPVTLLTLLNIRQIRKLNKNRIKRIVDESCSVWKCSRLRCRRVLFAEPMSNSRNDHLAVVTCPCSAQFCASCLQSPHWPALCTSAKNYHKLLEERSDDFIAKLLTDDELPEMLLRGKRCPSCGTFMQHSSNRKIQNCDCGCQFCWPCGKEVNEASKIDLHLECLERFEHNDNGFKEKVTSNENKEKNGVLTKWYRTALSHRKMRNPEVVAALYTMSDNLASTLSSISQTGRYLGDLAKAAVGWKRELKNWAMQNLKCLKAPLINNPEADLPQTNSRSSSVLSNRFALSDSEDLDKSFFESGIAKAVSNIVHLFLELHHVSEYTAVLLDNSHSPSGRLVRCMDRIEDICSALAILLQDPHVHNVNRIIPTFLRLQVQAKQVIEVMVTMLEEHNEERDLSKFKNSEAPESEK